MSRVFSPASLFEPLEEEAEKEKTPLSQKEEKNPLAYPAEFERRDSSCRYMDEIHEMAVSGKSISAAMATAMPMPGWDDILIMGAQLDPMPLDEHAEVETKTVIGKKRQETYGS